MKQFLTIFLVMALLNATEATAAVLTYTSRLSFNAAAGPTTIQDFESYLVDTPFHTIPVDVGDFTLSMTGNPSTEYNKIDLAPPDTSETDVNGSTNMRVFTNTLGRNLIFTFDAPVTSFGADFRSINNVIARTDLLIGISDTVAPPVAAATGLFSFFGVTSSNPFSTVTFRGIANDVYGIDNVTYGSQMSNAVPEPSSIIVWTPGIMTTISLRRKRRHNDQ